MDVNFDNIGTFPRIDIILGSMFSGKSTELIRRCSRLEAIGKNILYINHSFDTRTANYIQTHTQHKKTAIKVHHLFDIDDDLFQKADVIAIDEGQFFDDLYQFALKCESNKKSLIVSGLDGDSNRKPFGQILECIPLCDSVIKLTALDMIDKDGTEAIFSMRKKNVNQSDQVCVGASDSYLAVSRKNYIKYSKLNNLEK
jgi:thymidine kinase